MLIHSLKKDLFEFCRGNGKRRKRGKWLYMITQQETLIVVFLCTTYSDARYNDKYICISHMKQLNATIFISERTEQYSQNGFHIYLLSSILPCSIPKCSSSMLSQYKSQIPRDIGVFRRLLCQVSCREMFSSN